MGSSKKGQGKEKQGEKEKENKHIQLIRGAQVSISWRSFCLLFFPPCVKCGIGIWRAHSYIRMKKLPYVGTLLVFAILSIYPTGHCNARHTHTHRLDISFRLGVTDIFKFSIIISSGYLRTFEDEICQVVAENRGMWLLPLQKHRKEQDVVVCSEFLLVAKWRHLS